MMTSPRIVMMSLWRNDAGRRLKERAEHLLDRTYMNLRWVWVVGDSSDETEARLWAIARGVRSIQVVRHDTGIEGDDTPARLARLSATANAGFDRVRKSDDFWLIHESDLLTPPDLVERFLATGKEVVAGWPTLRLKQSTVFYDTWAFRGLDGANFTNLPPYHTDYRPDEPFRVSSVGTCWLFPARYLRAGVRIERLATVGLCRELTARGAEIWVDPRIPVVQPPELWVSRHFTPGVDN